MHCLDIRLSCLRDDCFLSHISPVGVSGAFNSSSFQFLSFCEVSIHTAVMCTMAQHFMQVVTISTILPAAVSVSLPYSCGTNILPLYYESIVLDCCDSVITYWYHFSPCIHRILSSQPVLAGARAGHKLRVSLSR